MRGQDGKSHGENEFLLASHAIRVKIEGIIFWGKLGRAPS